MDETFGMRHQSEDPPGRVANTGKIVHAAVGIVSIVSDSNLSIRADFFEDIVVSDSESSLTMCNWQRKPFTFFDEDAFITIDP